MEKKVLFYSLFIVNLATIILFWWHTSSFTVTTSLPTILYNLGRLLGLLLVYFVLIQFLTMGRPLWIEQSVGLDKLAHLHHWNGIFIISLLIFHPLLLTIGASGMTHQSFISQFSNFTVHYEEVFNAVIAAVLFLVIILFSLSIAKKHLTYEWWYLVHLGVYVAIILAWGHQLESGMDFQSNPIFVGYWYALYIFVFGNLILFRFLKPLYMFYIHRFEILQVIPENYNTNSVLITGKNLESFKIVPGQFLKVRFLQNPLWWEDHPFSVSEVLSHNYFRITVKNSGDFTSKISQLRQKTKVFIDGPFGVFTLDQTKNRKLLFIAGGVGITPIIALIKQAHARNKNVILLYSSKSEKDIIFKNELDGLINKETKIRFVLSQQKTPDTLHGRITTEMISQLVPDILERDVYLCGPQTMTNHMIKAMKELKVKPRNIHYEKFSL